MRLPVHAVWLALFSLVLFSACLKDKVVAPTLPEVCDTAKIGYAKDVKAILDANCNQSGCHNAKDYKSAGGYNFSDYDNATNYATTDKFFCSIRHGSGCQPMPKNAAPLSDCEIKKLQIWADSGFAP